MPLFHSNAVYAGWSVAARRRCRDGARELLRLAFLADIRRYGATYMNYVGKPLAYILATPERPDDADNPLRVAFGNEAADRDIEEFGRRFGCTVWDGFGSTETAVIITRPDDCPAGSIGQGLPGGGDLQRRDRCRMRGGALRCRRRAGQRRGRDGGVGQHQRKRTVPRLLQRPGRDRRTDARTASTGPATWPTATTTGWIYLAGRTADWMRVDGENLTAAPIERILLRLPAVSRVAVYPVPDEHVGDQVMAAMVLQDGAELTPGPSPSSWPASPTCRRRPGRATSGSPRSCPAPRPTRSSSATSSPAAPIRGGRCLWETVRSGVPRGALNRDRGHPPGEYVPVPGRFGVLAVDLA